MSAEEVLITHDGYTDTAYATCGDYKCTTVALRCIGASDQDAADYLGGPIDLGGNTIVEVVPLRESDSCEWCACCGTFIRHGLKYPGEDVGCTHDQDGPDPAELPGPHIDLRDCAPMKEYWGPSRYR